MFKGVTQSYQTELEKKEEELLDLKKQIELEQESLERQQLMLYSKKEEHDLLTSKLHFLKTLKSWEATAAHNNFNQLEEKEENIESADSKELTLDFIDQKKTEIVLMNELKLKNFKSGYELEDDLRLTFGNKATLAELYLNGNMVKLKVSIRSKISEGVIKKEVSIITMYDNIVREVDLHSLDP